MVQKTFVFSQKGFEPDVCKADKMLCKVVCYVSKIMYILIYCFFVPV